MDNLSSIKGYFRKENLLMTLSRMITQYRSRLVVLSIVLATLLLSFALPAGTPTRLQFLIAALFPAIGGVLLILRWPPLGLVLLVVICLIAPSPYLPGGLNIAVMFLGFLMGLWLLDKIVHRSLQPTLSPITRPLLAFVIISIIAFAVGQLTWFSLSQSAPMDAQIGGLAIFILSAVAFILVGYQINDIRWLKALTWTFLGLGALFVAGWVVPGLSRFTGRLFAPAAAANSMLWVWIVALAFGQFVFNKKLSFRKRLFLGGLVALTLYVGFFMNRDWKSGYIPPLAALVAVLAFRSWKLALFLIVAGILPAQFIASQAISTEDYSVGTRLDAWLIVLNMIELNPLLGFGPANYYWYTRLFPIRGWYVVFNSHNQYIDIVAQVGILGLASLMWFFGVLGRVGWRLRHRVPDGFAKGYVYGALGGLVGTLVSGMFVDWFLPFVYNIGLSGFRASMLTWLFLGGLLSLSRIYNTSNGNKLNSGELTASS